MFNSNVSNLGGLTVTIREASGANPGDIVSTLSGPSSIAVGENTFDADETVVLKPNTTYFINLATPAAAFSLQRTESDDEQALPGWAMGNTSRLQTLGTWNSNQQSLMFNLKGEEYTPPPDGSLVSNVNETATAQIGLVAGNAYSTSFTTGADPDGYSVESVSVSFHSVPSDPLDITATIRQGGQTNPGTILHTLKSPTSLTVGENSFRPTSDIVLDPGTEYFLTLESSTGTGTPATFNTTTSDGQQGEPGWAVGNNGQRFNGTTWVTASPSTIFTIKGYKRTDFTTLNNRALVTNLFRSSDVDRDINTNDRIATAFTTGAGEFGYNLEAIRLRWSQFPAGSDANNVTVTLHQEQVVVGVSYPGTLIHTFQNPAEFKNGPGFRTFRANGSLRLQKETTYHVVIRSSADNSGHVDATNSDAQTGDTGWTIADRGHFYDSPDWNQQNWSVKMAVHGSARTGNSLAELSESALNLTEGVTGTYTVHLAEEPPGNASVAITEEDGLLTFSPATINFNTVNWDDPRTVNVTPKHDDDGDNNSTTLVHTVTGYTDNGEPADLPVNITDDDELGFTFSPPSLNFQEGQSASYTVRLNTKPRFNTQVDVGWAAAGLNPTLDQRSITFTPDNWNIPQRINITTEPDSDATPNTTPIIHTAGGNYRNRSAALPVTVTEAASAGITITPATPSVTQGEETTFTVRLNAVPQDVGGVTITLTPRNSRLSVDPARFQISREDWKEPQTITLTASRNADPDGTNNSLRVSFASLDTNYRNLSVDDIEIDVGRAPRVTVFDTIMTVGETTVESSKDPRPLFGYRFGHANRPQLGSITNDKFSVAWQEHELLHLGRTDIEILSDPLIVDKLLYIEFNRRLPEGAILELDGEEFPTSQGQPSSDVSNRYRWKQDTPTWTDGQQVLVRILVPRFNVPVEVHASFGAPVYHAGENGQDAEIEVVLDKDPERTVNIGITQVSAGGASASEWEISDSNVAFAPGETSKTVTVTALPDDTYEEASTERVEVSFSANMPTGVRPGDQATTQVHLIDEAAYIWLEPEAVWVGEGDGLAHFTAVIQTLPHMRPGEGFDAGFQAQAVPAAEPGRTRAIFDQDYEQRFALVGGGTWTWNETCQCSEIRSQHSMPILDDDTTEPIEQFLIEVFEDNPAVITDHDRGPQGIYVNIVDNDGEGPVLSLHATDQEVQEGEPVELTIRMTQAFKETKTVHFRISAGRDKVFLTHDPFSWPVSAGVRQETIRIPTRNNAVREPDVDVTISIHDPNPRKPLSYDVGDMGSVTIRVTDNDPELHVPSEPRNLSATTGNRSMTLQWDTPTDEGRSPITGYQYRRVGTDKEEEDWTSIGNVTSHRLTGLNNDELHIYAVRAVNAQGPGPTPSGPATGTPTGSTTPLRPPAAAGSRLRRPGHPPVEPAHARRRLRRQPLRVPERCRTLDLHRKHRHVSPCHRTHQRPGVRLPHQGGQPSQQTRDRNPHHRRHSRGGSGTPDRGGRRGPGSP